MADVALGTASFMMEAKASLKNIQAEGVANNGAVKVILNGNHEMIKIDIDPKLMTEKRSFRRFDYYSY